jgi:hypothetical protein
MTTIPSLPFNGQQLRDTLSSLDGAIDGKEASGTASAAVAAHVAAADPHLNKYASAAQGALAATAIQPGNAALSDAREWSAATVSQVEAEAGVSTSRRAFTPQRVFQAVAAWWAGSEFATKLAGIASGATANSSDATLLDRANHTGEQAVGTITGLGTAATLNHGTAAGNLVRLDPTTGKLPAVDGSQLTGLPGGSGTSNQQYAVGHWISPVMGVASSGTVMVANNMVLHQFVLFRSITVGELGARINTAAAGASIQLAIYASLNGEPSGAPLGNTASLSAGTAGPVSDNVTDFNITGGVVYWMALNSDGAPVLQGWGNSNLYAAWILGAPTLAQVANAATSVSVWRSITHTFGTWPTLTPGATAVATNNPRGGIVFLQISALS